MTNLTPDEARVLACITDAAAAGRRFPTADDLLEVLGCESHSTTVRLVGNLERKGIIRMEVYQRERRATIVATGQQTAEVRTKAPHWRVREQHLPEPLKTIQVQDDTLFRSILRAARHERKPPAKFVMVLVREAMAARSIQSAAVEG